MTACAIEPASTGVGGGAPQPGCAITADGAYAARLARDGDAWFPERWTLDGPEPYAVALPGNQPEEPGTQVQPMGDGRVLIHRPTGRRHTFGLLYPTGSGTGELPLGAVECPGPGTRVTLLPPAPGGAHACALAAGPASAAVWLVAGGAAAPVRLAQVPGRCSGGVWLDRAGRLLAVDRELGGRTKTVVVDLARGGEVSPLLELADGSDDRLLLADPDSGLLLVASDAPCPGRERLGWGVLGSALPVRFPRCLRVADCAVTPFAIQPGQSLAPEHCAVALRVDGPFGTWLGTWRPAERRVRHLPAPEGWLTGSGMWTAEGVLRLPYATAENPCGVRELRAPRMAAPRVAAAWSGAATAGAATPRSAAAGSGSAEGCAGAGPGTPGGAPPADGVRSGSARDAAGTGPDGPLAGGCEQPRQSVEPGAAQPVTARPVPLQEAPLARLVTN